MDFNKTNIEDQNQEVTSVDESIELPESGATVKERQGFFGRVMGKFAPNKEVEDTTEEVEGDVTETSEETERTEETTESFEITDDIREAAHEAGWDDDKIEKYGKEDPDVLKLLFNQYKAAPPVYEEPEEKDETPRQKLEKVELSKEALDELKDQYGGEVVDKVISPLVEKLNKVVDVLDAQAESGQATQRAVSNVVMAEREKNFQQKLDILDEKLPVFGKWENVPRDAKGQINVNSPQFKARAEVWVGAQKLAQAGFDWDTALDNSIAMYKGKNLETTIKSQMVRDLNKRKEQFTPRPTHKKTKPVKLEGKAAGIKAIRDAAKEMGVEL